MRKCVLNVIYCTRSIPVIWNKQLIPLTFLRAKLKDILTHCEIIVSGV